MDDHHLDPPSRSGGADPSPPDELNVRPVSRLLWCGGFVALGAAGLVWGMVAMFGAFGTVQDTTFAVISMVLGTGCIGVGLLGLRMGITADADGVTVSKLTGRTTIRWPDLVDIEFVEVPADLSLGFHWIVFVTRDGHRVAADAPTGRVGPDTALVKLRDVLLAMRNRNLSTPPDSPDPLKSPDSLGLLDVGRSPSARSDPPPRPMDTVSVIAFVLSLVGVGIVAIPLAIWRLLRAGPNRRGRGLAVSALAISVAWVVVGSVALVTSGLLGDAGGPTATDQTPGIPAATPPDAGAMTSVTPTPSGETVAAPTSPLVKPHKVFWADLKATMCIRDAPDDAVDIKVVDCRAEHEAEVMAAVDLGGKKSWPGDTEVDKVAESACRDAFAGYVALAYDDSRLEYDYFTADKAGWQAGEHTEICLVRDPEHTTLTHALKGVAE